MNIIALPKLNQSYVKSCTLCATKAPSLGERRSNNYPSSQGPNNKREVRFQNIHAGEPMTLVDLITQFR